MASVQPSVKEQNLQSSLLFMQQEHAHTLKGLHEEINKLQNKCKDLTFQLAMETTSVPQEEYYIAKCEEKEKELTQWKSKARQLDEQATERETRITQLEKRLKRLEYKHLEELKSKSEIIQRIQGELLSKSEEVTHFQLTGRSSTSDQERKANHRHRMSSGSSVEFEASPRNSRSSRGRRMSCDSLDSPSSPSPQVVSQSVPHPPSYASGNMASSVQSHQRKSLNAVVINRPASGRKMRNDHDGATVQELDDEQTLAEIREIAKRQKAEMGHQRGGSGGGTSSKLPPIPPAGAPPRGPPRLHKANSAAFRRRPPPGAEGKEPVQVETLAVDQVNGGKKINLRQAQEFNSQDM